MNPNEAEIYHWENRFSEWWLWGLGWGTLIVTPEGDCWKWDIERGLKLRFIGRFWWIRLKWRLAFQETIRLGELNYTARWRWRYPFVHLLLARAIPAVALFTLLAHLFGH